MSDSVSQARAAEFFGTDAQRKELRELVTKERENGMTIENIAHKHHLAESIILALLGSGMRPIPHDLTKLDPNVTVGEGGYPIFEDVSGYGEDPDRFLKAAKLYVVGANAVITAETGEYELKVEDLYVVWFAKVVGNWKALISTNQPGDGLYFEVTHNEAAEETYVDIYGKKANHVFSHHDH